MGKPHVRHSLVLVLDYQPTPAKSIYDALTRRGFEVILVSSGSEAFRLLETRTHIDLVLIDMDLSENGAIAFADGLRQIERFRSTRILMMSSHITFPMSSRVIEQGEIVLVLRRPIAPDMLLDEAVKAIASFSK